MERQYWYQICSYRLCYLCVVWLSYLGLGATLSSQSRLPRPDMASMLLVALLAFLNPVAAFSPASALPHPIGVRQTSSSPVVMAVGLRNGDMVKVIAGDSKVCRCSTVHHHNPYLGGHQRWTLIDLLTSPLPQGMTAKLLAVDKKKGMVVVEGVNMRTKHVKPMKEGESGSLLKKEKPIHISNVALADEQPADAEAE